MIFDLKVEETCDLLVLLESHIEALSSALERKEVVGITADDLRKRLDRHIALKVMLQKPLDF